jgi:hypothetical protein
MTGSLERHIIMESESINFSPAYHTLSHSSLVEMGSFNEKNDEKHDQVFIDTHQVDTGAQLDASLHTPLDPNESLRIR